MADTDRVQRLGNDAVFVFDGEVVVVTEVLEEAPAGRSVVEWNEHQAVALGK